MPALPTKRNEGEMSKSILLAVATWPLTVIGAVILHRLNVEWDDEGGYV